MPAVFLQLPDNTLRALASALRCGRLTAPYTTLTIQRYCSAGETASVAARLQELSAEGMKSEHLALLLESVVAGRGQHADAGEVVELVWTGPELPGMVNRDTAAVVHGLFASARESVLLAGYAVYQGRDLFRPLAERYDQEPGLRVRLFLDVQRSWTDTSTDAEILRRFAERFRRDEWPGERMPEVFYDPRSLAHDAAKRSSLHAKCVVIDRRVAFVSSANFTEAAQVRNIEVGALIDSPHFAARLVEHFERLAEARLLVPLDFRE
jgi:phosphatidylserine/phosphatidylglycerophosphate/cardiolipin synthase-like enzyme